MTLGDSINPLDRDLMKRLTIVLLFVFLFTAAFAHLEQTYSQKFFDDTGEAKWIWAQHRMSLNEPLAFFASRDFTLPEKRVYTHLKVFGDPEYTVWVNGHELATRRVGTERVLDQYDVSQLVRTGRNRIVVAVRAPQGVGGLIAAVDIGPEAANWVVTDGRWKIHRRWEPAILLRDVETSLMQAPMIVGEPPIGRWNYLDTRLASFDPPPSAVLAPKESFEQLGLVPQISTQGGVAVAIAKRSRATVFDFGFTTGRVRLTNRAEKIFFSRAINVRLANHRDELGLIEWRMRPIVLAPGERTVTMSETHSFRYVMAFAREVGVEVVK